MNKGIKYIVVVNVIAVLLMIAITYLPPAGRPIPAVDLHQYSPQTKLFYTVYGTRVQLKRQVSVFLFKVLEAHKRQSMVSVDI